LNTIESSAKILFAFITPTCEPSRSARESLGFWNRETYFTSINRPVSLYIDAGRLNTLISPFNKSHKYYGGSFSTSSSVLGSKVHSSQIFNIINRLTLLFIFNAGIS